MDFKANQVFVMKTLFPDWITQSPESFVYQPNPHVPAVSLSPSTFRAALTYEGRFRPSESGHWVVNMGRRSGTTAISSELVQRGLAEAGFPDVYYTAQNACSISAFTSRIHPKFRRSVKSRILLSSNRIRGLDLHGAYLIIDNASFHKDLDQILLCAIPTNCRIILTGVSNGGFDAYARSAFQCQSQDEAGRDLPMLLGAGLIDLSSFESGVVSPREVISLFGESQFKSEYGCGPLAWPEMVAQAR